MLTPEKKRKIQIEAAKAGAKVAPLLKDHSGYKSQKEKIEEDAELKLFLTQVS